MSTSPSVIRRFVEYYAGLDAQPPAALAALYHPDAERSFWSASGAVRHSALLYPSAGQRGAVPVHHRHAALRRPAVRRDLDHALVASAHCRRRNPGPAGLLGGGHRRGAGSPSARLLRRRGDDLRASSPAGLGGTRREAEGALMMTVLITGASSGIGAGLAKSFAADGHLVIACGRDASRLAALQQFSPNISVRLFDMTDRDACRRR